MRTLYIVATPIGNLEDITVRAIKTILSADVIACEDTRRTGQLLKNCELKIENAKWKINELTINENRRLISYYDEVEESKAQEIVDLILSGKKVVLVSDSGTPLVSDPGFKLIQASLRNNIGIVSIPGATAIINALVSSGLPANQFLFLGFIPSKQSKRQKLLTDLKEAFSTSSIINPTIIFYESPWRIYKTLNDIRETFGDIVIVICRELTKIYEEVIRGKISEILAKQKNIKGEITILFTVKTLRE